MQLRVAADQMTRPDDAGSFTPLQRLCTFIRVLRLSNYINTSMVLEETSHLRTVFYPPPYSPKPVRYPFQGGVKIRNIKSMPPSGNTRQPLDDKPGGSQLVSAGKKMGPRRETSIVGKHKPPFHGVRSVCEGERRHHLVLARPVRFLTNVANG